MNSLFKIVSLALLAVTVGGSTRPVPTIELARIKPSQIMTGPYSFYVPPYSDYYFHHMDQLGLRLDWIRPGGPVYALQEPKAPFTTSYTYQGHIDPAKHVVVVETSAWPQPDPDARWDEMDKVMQAITAKSSAE